MPTTALLPPQGPFWGTANRGDADDTRRTRGLGLGAAVRRYNDLAVPGIGGLWFAKPLVWSLIGLALGGKGATRVEVANGVEVVAMFHALASNGGGRNPRINGSTKLGRHGGRFPTFAEARRRAFYVTVPFRQGMVQPLRDLGLATAEIQRFNAYTPTAEGRALLQASLEPFPAYNRGVLPVIDDWLRGAAAKTLMTGHMAQGLTPLTGLPRPAAELLRDRIVTGDKGRDRRRVRDWLRDVKRTKSVVAWNARPAAFDEDHWNDIRDGARFFLMRDAALRVLDAVEALLRTTGRNEAKLVDAITAAEAPIDRLRSAAKEFLSGGREERAPGALAFAQATSLPDDGAVLTFLAERDGRGIRPTPTGVAAGSAFDPHGPVAAPLADQPPEDTAEGAESAAPEVADLRLPPGASRRLNALHSLDDDIEASCAGTKLPTEAADE
jgi:hypothetical protein